jgi:hypothetical protein
VTPAPQEWEVHPVEPHTDALAGGCRFPLSWMPHSLCDLSLSPWSKPGEFVVLTAHLSKWYVVVYQGRN